jgi:hypothetical protein
VKAVALRRTELVNLSVRLRSPRIAQGRGHGKRRTTNYRPNARRKRYRENTGSRNLRCTKMSAFPWRIRHFRRIRHFNGRKPGAPWPVSTGNRGCCAGPSRWVWATARLARPASRISRAWFQKEKNARQGFWEHSDYETFRDALPVDERGPIMFGYWTGCRQ